MSHRFHLLNVFTETQWGGNPLCVVENADGLDGAMMQTLARQFNLSETVFLSSKLSPSSKAVSAMRIFTPSIELAFAGHPSLGAAAVVAELNGGLSQFQIECQAGVIDLCKYEGEPTKALHSQTSQLTLWSLRAPCESLQCARPLGFPMRDLAELLGIEEDEFFAEPEWVNTGNEHLLIPVKQASTLACASINLSRLSEWPSTSQGRQNAYLFALEGADSDQIEIEARYWFVKAGAIAEDPATGSAAANLGAWLLRRRSGRSFKANIQQGAAMQRPSQLRLEASLDVNQVPRIHVGGGVIEIGSGVLHL